VNFSEAPNSANRSDNPMSPARATPQRNTAELLEVLATFIFLTAVLCVTIGSFVADFLLKRTLTGAGVALCAVGLACLGLSGIALYRHPEQLSPKNVERFRRRRISAREHAVGLVCYSLTCAPALAVLSVETITGAIFTAPMATMGIVAAAIMVIAISPLIVIRVRGLLRRR